MRRLSAEVLADTWEVNTRFDAKRVEDPASPPWVLAAIQLTSLQQDTDNVGGSQTLDSQSPKPLAPKATSPLPPRR